VCGIMTEEVVEIDGAITMPLLEIAIARMV
jgi:hypothetical protein